jgi:hypothetical protein
MSTGQAAKWASGPSAQCAEKKESVVAVDSVAQASSTLSSRAKYPQHSVMLPLETFETRKYLLTLSSKAEMEHGSNFEKLLAIYLWTPT